METREWVAGCLVGGKRKWVVFHKKQNKRIIIIISIKE